MKKIVKSIMLMLLTLFSFFYTERVINFINKKDPLMQKIVDTKINYDIMPVSAIIDDDTIIPGIIGREVDVEKSYNKMKISSVFREELLVFKKLYPDNILSDNINKYIIKGNETKKEIAILFIFNDNFIGDLMNIDGITIFINHKDINLSNINSLKAKEIYTYGNNGIYNKEILQNDNSLINKISNNKSNYCLLKEKNDNMLKQCNDNGMYVVIPTIIGGYYEIKKNLSNGDIILLDSLNDIGNIIKYINSKGYNIVSLSELLNQ